MQVIIPMALFDAVESFDYPKYLTEIDRKILIEHVVDSLRTKKVEQEFIFMVSELYERRFFASETLSQIADVAKVVVLKQQTSGAIATILMGIDHYREDDSALIVSHDQVLYGGIDDFLEFCESSKSDASLITFDSIHPKWSHVRVTQPYHVVQASGREAISRVASSGIYYFRRLGDFLELSKKLILKNYNLPEGYYVNLVLNEYILVGKKVTNFHIDNERIKLYK